MLGEEILSTYPNLKVSVAVLSYFSSVNLTHIESAQMLNPFVSNFWTVKTLATFERLKQHHLAEMWKL